MPAGAIIGRITCTANHNQDLTLEKGFRRLPTGAYQQMFAAALTEAGYKPSGTDSLFQEASEEEPELRVGAAITAVNMEACYERQLRLQIGPFVTGHDAQHYKITLTETIDWQVFDSLNRRIVLRTTTQGHGEAKGKYDEAQYQAMYDAFSDGARQLMALPDFRTVSLHSGQELAARDALSNHPAAVTTIPRVPHSTRPFQDHVKNTEAHVVVVYAPGGQGSGFYIADGLLLTNHHVASQGTTVKIHFLSGKDVTGLTVASDPARDVALIRTENVDLPGLPLRLQAPEVGSTVFVMGTPAMKELEGTVTSGIVSASSRQYDHRNWIQSDVAVTHGNSGGPMLDDKGNVIGMTDRGIAARGELVPNVNLFIPIAEALESVGVVVQPSEPVRAAKVSAKKKAAP
jgi:S1-C subfamily serine protease